MRKYKIMKRKEVLFTPAEWEAVVKRANSVSMKPASFIRRIAVNGSVNIYNYPELTALMNGMRIIGNNINQLTHYANICIKSGVVSEAVIQEMNQTIGELTKIEIKLEDIMRRIVKG